MKKSLTILLIAILLLPCLLAGCTPATVFGSPLLLPLLLPDEETTTADSETTAPDATETCTHETTAPDAPETCTHETTEWVVTENATCSKAGAKSKQCVSCKKVLETAIIETTAHTEEIIAGKAATCSEKGLTAGKKCSVCKTVILEQQEIAALEHNESDWIIDKCAEIGTAGSKHKVCLRCNTTTTTEAIPAISESHSHQGKEWIVVTPPSCKETGTRHFICDCGKQMSSDTLAVTPHTEEVILGIAATCTTSGKTDGKKCTVCSSTTVSQIVIPPLGHSFSNGTCQACGISEPYGVWIVDGLGNPVSGIIVKVMQNGEQVKMYPYNGKFLSMKLELGTYQIVLDLAQLSDSYTFDESLCTLTPENRSITIRLLQTVTEETVVYVGDPIAADYPAYYIKEGATKVTLTPNDYTFFIFYPTTAAIYTITYENNSNLTISYHGGSFFVQGRDLSEDSSGFSKYENGIAFSIYASNLGGEYVFAVKSTTETSCVLKIKNEGDPGSRIEDTPWVPYLEDTAMVEKQLNTTVSGTYTTIDVTDLSLKAVYNAEDGYYHLGSEDGPIIFIDLTSDTPFVDSIQTICGYQRMGSYIYDVNGELIEKRTYNELFHQYGMPTSADVTVDSPIRVPLTLKLAEAIQNFGEKNAWWGPTNGNIFTTVLLGAPYNQEYAWLLFCGYYA